MISRLRASLIPRIPPEQRIAWALTSRNVVLTILAISLVLLLFEASQYFLGPMPADSMRLIGIFISTVAVGASTGVALLWIRRGRIISAGHLFAITLLVLGVITLMVDIFGLIMPTAALILSVVVVGAIVGGRSGFPYAIAGGLALFASLLGPAVVPQEALPFELQNPGLQYVFIQSLLLLGLASILNQVSNYLYQTIDKLQSQAGKLSELAHTDPLTGLSNRRHFIEQLKREFGRANRYQRPLAILYIDLDGFKAINDAFGHMYGDDILRGVARSMRAVLRSTDLLARIGGDEFAVLLPETAEEGAINVSNKLSRALFAYSKQLGPAVPDLTFCGGVSQLKRGDNSIDDLLARADEAQYFAKATGKAHTRTFAEVDQMSSTKPTRI